MHEYELLIETINPCGGEAHAKKEFTTAQAAAISASVPSTMIFFTTFSVIALLAATTTRGS